MFSKEIIHTFLAFQNVGYVASKMM